MQAGLDAGQGNGEENADDHQRGDQRRLQRGLAEDQQAQRKADVAGIGIGRAKGVEAGVDQRLLLQAAVEQGEGEHAKQPALKAATKPGCQTAAQCEVAVILNSSAGRPSQTTKRLSSEAAVGPRRPLRRHR